MSKFIKHIKARGIHKRFDIDLSLEDGVNIVHGRNGTGKTTLLHILANAVNGDFRRFSYLTFRDLEIILDDNKKVKIEQNWDDYDDTKTEVFLNDNGQELLLDSFTSNEVKQEEKRNDPSERKKFLVRQKTQRKLFNIDLNVTYFPAFRTMIEAWATLDDREIRHLARNRSMSQRLFPSSFNRSTGFARTLFGDFVPALNYPSPLEIAEQINQDLLEIQLKVARSDRDILSTAFVQAFAAISQNYDTSDIHETPEKILQSIKDISVNLQNLPFQIVDQANDQANTVYDELRDQLDSFQLDSKSQNIDIVKRVLSVYKSSLQKRSEEQKSAYSSIETYLESVNEFLERKKLVIQSAREQNPRLGARLGVRIGEESSSHSLQTLSSGERQIVGLIYAASHMADGKVVLIDEPEISLHIDWQSKLLPEIVKQLLDKQLIVCTHSPIIASDYRNRMIELKLETTSSINTLDNQDILENELEEIL